MGKLKLNKKDFEVLFKEHYEGLYYHAFSFLNDQDLAKDIISDVFEQLWKERNRFDISYSLKPFLYQMVKNRCINYIRHQEVKRKYIDFSLSNQLEVEKDHQEYEQLIQKVIKRIESLPPKTKVVFKLCFLENKKYKEVEEELGISINTVKTHIKKALKTLRDDFSSEPLIMLFLNRAFV